MGNSPFRPLQIDLATFSSHSIQTLQRNKQLNSYIKQKFNTSTIKKLKAQRPYSYQIWELIEKDLSFTNMKILFQSLKQVKFSAIFLSQLENYKYPDIIRSNKDLQNFQVNIVQSLNYSTFLKLKHLSINYCSIKSIKGLSFLNTPNLIRLDISYNPISNFKAFNKCNFSNLNDLNVQHSSTRQSYYLINLARCNLSKQMKFIDLDRNYIRKVQLVYNPLQKPKQSIDMRPLFKWNCKLIDNISIRQGADWDNWNKQGTIKGYKLKIRQKIERKYTFINIELIYQ